MFWWLQKLSYLTHNPYINIPHSYPTEHHYKHNTTETPCPYKSNSSHLLSFVHYDLLAMLWTQTHSKVRYFP